MRAFEPSRISKVVPGSPVPFIVGVASLVMRFAVGFARVGERGRRVSITIFLFVAELIFPDISIALTLRLFVHSASAGAISQDQFPLPSTIVVQVSPRGPVTVIVVPISPLPCRVGVVSERLCPELGLEIRGLLGLLESIVRVISGELADSFQVASVSV